MCVCVCACVCACVFEKNLYKQHNLFINVSLSDKLCGFRENYSTQHCLLAMTEKIKNAIGTHSKIEGGFVTFLVTSLLYLTEAELSGLQ